jgi:hypothetical protein
MISDLASAKQAVDSAARWATCLQEAAEALKDSQREDVLLTGQLAIGGRRVTTTLAAQGQAVLLSTRLDDPLLADIHGRREILALSTLLMSCMGMAIGLGAEGLMLLQRWPLHNALPGTDLACAATDLTVMAALIEKFGPCDFREALIRKSTERTA